MGQYIIDENGERVLVNPRPQAPQELKPAAVEDETVSEETEDE